MRDTLKRRIALLLALSLIVSVVAVSAAGAINIKREYDRETTTDPQTSDVKGTGDYISDLRNDSNETNIRVNTTIAVNPEDVTADLIINESGHPHNGTTLESYNASWNKVETRTIGQTTTHTYRHFSLNISHQEVFDELERDAGEKISMDINVTFNETDPLTTQMSLRNVTFVNGSDENAVIVADEDEVESENKSSLNPFVDLSDQVAANHEQEIGVNETTDTIVVSTNDTDAETALDEVGDADSNTLSAIGMVFIEEEPVPLFAESVDTGDHEWLDSGDRYATVEEDGSKVVIENANTTFDDDTSTVEVTVVGNTEVGFWRMHSMLRDDYDASRWTAAELAWDAQSWGDAEVDIPE